MSAPFSAEMHANGTLNSIKVRYLIQKNKPFFSELSALENVPKQHKQSYASFHGQVILRIRTHYEALGICEGHTDTRGEQRETKCIP